jgi:hypothetical protein
MMNSSVFKSHFEEVWDNPRECHATVFSIKGTFGPRSLIA